MDAVSRIYLSIAEDPIEFFEINYSFIPKGVRRDKCYSTFLAFLLGTYNTLDMKLVEELLKISELPPVTSTVIRHWKELNISQEDLQSLLTERLHKYIRPDTTLTEFYE